jgi:hypothetical protein
MLQQMLLEDKDDTVKETAVRSLALIVAFMDDKDKYFQVSSDSLHCAAVIWLACVSQPLGLHILNFMWNH